MTNLYDSPAGDGDGATPAGLPEPDAKAGRRGTSRRMLRWGAGATLAGFLAGGGIALAVSSSGAPAASPAGVAETASSAQAAQLNSDLSTAASTAAARRRVRWALARLRRIGGVDGEFTFHDKTGFHSLAFERGTISSVSGSDVVVRAANGTTWTWLIVSDTVVREDGAKTTTGALGEGQTVFAGGPVVDGAKDARLIVIRKAGSGSAKTSVS
jgi:hypothetical protein